MHPARLPGRLSSLEQQSDGGSMRIGVVSDTHNNLKNVRRIVELFNAAAVEQVVHTGDITQAKTLEVFAQLSAPMVGVFGNNDQERDSLNAAIQKYGFEFYEPPLHIQWAQRQLIVVHDPLEFEGHLHPDIDLALHGHTHRHHLETWGERTTVFNPGECAGHLSGYNAIGVVDLSSLETQLIHF